MADFPVSEKAKTRLKENATEVYKSMRIIAIELARRDGADEVQTSHADEAHEILSPKQRRNQLKLFAQIVGGALIGAFFPGFVSALPTETTPAKAFSLIVYTAFGIVGTSLVLYFR